MQANNITNINGKAAATDAVCRDFKPPASKRAVARSACKIPQTNCLFLGGFKSPLELNIPSTKVAEFAEVIKKVPSKNTAINDSRLPKG